VQRERSTIKAAGRRLAVQRLRPDGAMAGPPLLFLHEGLGCVAMWKDFPSRLCARLGLEGVCYDRWGHGLSEPLDRPRDARYLHDEALVFLPEVLRGLGIEHAALFGHSDGGTIALLFAAAFPQAAAALVTEAAHVFVEEETLAGIRAAVGTYATTDLPARLARYHGDKTGGLFRAWHETWLSPAFRDWNIEAELPRIGCPSLLLQGEADEYGTAAQVETIARGVAGPVETGLLPGCGHAPHLQAADAVLERAARFLERHLAREIGR
jgi:pimeloyl-ACP methyl ester carboxylesterase